LTPLQHDPETYKLLCTRLDSFEKLEIVRLLRASGQPMSRADLQTAGRFSSDTVVEALGSLAQSRLIEIDEATSLVRLGSPAHERAFHAVMSAYEDDRAAVLSLLSTIAMERIRSMAARAFAEAFVLRKKRGDDDG
jgi:hypothetical protein